MSRGDAIALVALLVALIGLPAAWFALPAVQDYWRLATARVKRTIVIAYLLVVLACLSILAWPRPSDTSRTETTPPVKDSPPPRDSNGTPTANQTPISPKVSHSSTSPIVRISGTVTPIPKTPARVIIDGKNGEWPINSSGQFAFRISGKLGDEIRVRVLEGNDVVYDNYQFISGTPLAIAISENK